MLVFLLAAPLMSRAAEQPSEEEWKAWAEKCSKYHRNPDSLRLYGARLLASEVPQAKFEGYFALGYRQEFLYHIDTALMYYNKANAIRKKYLPENNALYYRLATRLSQAHSRNNHHDSTLLIIDELLQGDLLDSGTVPWARMLKNKGLTLRLVGREQASLEALLAALPVLLANKDRESPNTMVSIALNYLQLGQDSIAKHWFHRCRVNAWEINDAAVMARAMNNLGKFHLDHKQPDSALFYFSWLQQNKQGVNNETRSYIYQNLTKTFLLLKEKERAAPFLDSTLQLIDTSASSLRAIEVLELLAQFELQAAQEERALYFVNRALARNSKNLDLHRQLSLLLTKATILEASGQLQESLQLLKQYQHKKDSLQTVRDIEKIHDLMGRYELEENMQRVEKEINKRWGYNVALILAILLLPAVYFFAQLKNRKVSLKAMESELLMAKEQMVAQAAESEPVQMLTLTGNLMVPLDKLLYGEKQDRYVLLTMSEGKSKHTRMSLAGIIALAPHALVQIHRSYFIHWEEVRQVNYDTVEMSNGEKLPLGRSFRSKLLQEQHPLMNRKQT